MEKIWNLLFSQEQEKKQAILIHWRYIEGPRDLLNLFTITRLRYIKVLSHIRGVARIFQRGGHRGYSPDHHLGIADYIWFIPLLSLVYQRAQSYYHDMKALIN